MKMTDKDEFANATEAGGSTGEMWNVDEQAVIFGTYYSQKTNVGQNNSNVYVIKEDDKEESTGVWGSTVLDSKFEDIPVGSRVKIEFLGRVSGKSPQPYKDYKVVFVKPKVDTPFGEATEK